jgi:hypothetical protein
MKTKAHTAEKKPTAEQQRVSKIQGSYGYKSKVKKSVEQLKRYLRQVHNRDIKREDVKIVKYLLVPIEKERRDNNN